MGTMLAELVAFAIIGIVFSLIAWLFTQGKKAVFGSELSQKEKEAVNTFKERHSEPPQAPSSDLDVEQKRQLAERLESFRSQHPIDERTK